MKYYKKEHEEEYYIFDSKILSEEEFEEKIEYDGYNVFADSLTGDEVVKLLNESHEENQALQKHIKRNTLSKIRVEDLFDYAKYGKFYNNEEAIKIIDWIAKELRVNLID